MTPPEEQSNINALSSLLDAKGLDASDFIDVINALSNIKKRDAEKEVKGQEKETVKEKKIFVDTRNGSKYVFINGVPTKIVPISPDQLASNQTNNNNVASIHTKEINTN